MRKSTKDYDEIAARHRLLCISPLAYCRLFGGPRGSRGGLWTKVRLEKHKCSTILDMGTW